MFVNLLMMTAVSFAVAMIFRHIDSKNRSFDKVAGLYKKIRKEFTDFADEKYKSLRDFDDSVEVSVKKGDSMINELKKTISDIVEVRDHLLSDKSRLDEYLLKIDSIGSSIEEMGNAVSEIEKSNDYINGLDSKLEQFRKELALVDRDLNRIEDNFRKENTIALKNVTGKVLKEFEDDLERIRKESEQVSVNINIKSEDVLKQLEEKEKFYFDKFDFLNSQYEEIENRINSKIDDFSSQIDSTLSCLYDKTDKRLEQYTFSFNDLENKLKSSIIKERNDTVAIIRDEFKKENDDIMDNLESKKNEIIDDINYISKNSTLDIENTFSKLKVIEERLNEQIITAENKTGDIELIVSDFEKTLYKLIDEKTFVFKDKIEGISGSIKDLEGDIFHSIRLKLEKFSERVEDEITSTNIMIESKIEKSFLDADNVENKVASLEEKLVSLNTLFSDKVREIDYLSEELKKDSINKITIINSGINEEIDKLKNYYENEKSELLDRISVYFQKTDDESKKKLMDIKKKIEAVYTGFSNRLLNLEGELSDKTKLIENKFEEKISGLEVILQDKEEYVNSMVKSKLDGLFNDALTVNKNYVDSLDNNKEHLNSLYSDFISLIENSKESISEEMAIVEKTAKNNLNQYNVKLEELEEEFRLLNDKIIKENSLKLCSLEDQYEAITSKLSGFDITIQDELVKKGNFIEEKVALLSKILEKAENDVSARLESTSSVLSAKTEQIVDQYKNELSEIKDNMQKLNNLYETRLDDKYSEIDKTFLDRMKEVNELVERINEISRKYTGKLEDFDFKVNTIESDINSKLINIENEYINKNEELVLRSEKSISEIEKKYDFINEKIDELNKGFLTDIDSRILQAKSEIDSIMDLNRKKFDQQVDYISCDVENRFETFKNELDNIKLSYNELENDFQSRFESFITEKEFEDKELVGNFIENNASALERIKNNLIVLEEEYSKKMSEFESYYKEKVGSVVDEKVKFIINAEERLKRIDDALSDNELRMESEVDEKLESARKLIDSFFESSHSNMALKYKELENETIGSIEKYKNDLLRIKQNIKVIDDKFGTKFAKKLESADEKLSVKIDEISMKCEDFLKDLSARIEENDNNYLRKLETIESDFTDKNNQIIEKNKVELSDYTSKIESLMNEITDVKQYLNEDFRILVENGKTEIKDFFNIEMKSASGEYRELEDSIKELINSYKGQILKIKEGMKSIDEKLSVKIADKLSEADNTLQEKYSQINEKYNENISLLNQRLEKIEESFAEKIDGLEEKYLERGESFIVEGYKKFAELQENINSVNVDLSNLKSDIDAEFSAKLKEGNVLLDNLFSDGKEQLEEYHNNLKEKAVNELQVQFNQVEKLKEDIKELDEKVNVSIIMKLSKLDEKIGEKFGELNSKYNSQISSVKERIAGFEDSFNLRLDQIASNFSDKNEELFRNNLEKLSDYSLKFKEVELSIEELKSRIEDEISEKIDDTLKNSYEIINQKGNEIADSYISIANDYELKLEQLENTVSDKLSRANETFTHGIEDIKVNFISLKNNLENDFDIYKENLSASAGELVLQNAGEIERISNEYKALLEMIENTKSGIDNIHINTKADGEKISADFKNMFASFFDEILSEKERLFAENNEQVEDVIRNYKELEKVIEDTKNDRAKLLEENAAELYKLSVKYQSLTDDISDYKNNIDNQISEKISSGLDAVDRVINSRVSELERSYVSMCDEIESKNVSYREMLAKLEDKINSFDSIFVDKLNEKITNSDSFISDRIRDLSNSVKVLEDEYKAAFTDLDVKLSDVTNEIDGKSEVFLSNLIGRYEALGNDISSFELRVNEEISAKFNEAFLNIEKEMSLRLNDLKEEERTAAEEVLSGIRKQSAMIEELNQKIQSVNEQYRNAVEKGLNDSQGIIEVRIEELNTKISRLEVEKANELDCIFKSVREENSNYIGEMSEYVVGLQKNYEILNESISTVKNRIDNEISERLTRGLDGVDIIVNEKIGEINEKYSMIKTETNQNIQALTDKLESIANRFSRIDNEIEERINSKTKEELYKVTAAVNGKENELLNRINDIQCDADEKIRKYKSSIDEFSSVIEGINDKLNQRIDERIDVIEDGVRERISNLAVEVEGLKNKFSDDIDNFLKDFAERENAAFSDTEEKLSSIKEDIQKINLHYEAKLNEKYLDIDKNFVDRMKEVNELVESINDISKRYTNRLDDFDSKAANAETDMSERLSVIESDYKLRNDELLKNSYNLISELEKKYDFLNERNDELSKGFITDIDSRILKAKSEIDSLIEANKKKFDIQLDSMCSEVEEKFEGFKGELGFIKSSFSKAENELNEKNNSINEKLAGVSSTLEDKISEFEKNLTYRLSNAESTYKVEIEEMKSGFSALKNEIEIDYEKFKDYISQSAERLADANNNEAEAIIEKYNSLKEMIDRACQSIEYINEGVKDNAGKISESFNEKLDELLYQSSEKQSNFYKEKNELFSDLAAKYNSLNDDISEYKSRIDNQISEKINEGIESVDKIINERVSSLEKSYNSLQSEIEEKNMRYREILNKLEDKISSFDSVFIDRLNEKISNSDSFISERINDLNNSVNILESEYKSKLTLLDADLNDVKAELTSQSEQYITDLKSQYEQLGEEIYSFEEKINKEIDRKLTEAVNNADSIMNERMTLLKEGEKVLSQEILSKIREQSEYVENLTSKISVLESDYKSALRNGLDDSGRIIENSIEQLNNRISQIEIEKVNELDSLFNSLKEDNSNYIESVNNYVADLKNSYADLENSITDIRGRIDNEIPEMIKSRTEESLDNVAGLIRRSEADILNTVNAFKSDVNSMIGEYRLSIEKFADEIDGMNDALNSRIDERIDVIEGGVKTRITNLASDVVVLKNNFSSDIENFLNSYREREDEIFSKTDEKISAFEREVISLKDELSDIRKVTKDNLDSEIESVSAMVNRTESELEMFKANIIEMVKTEVGELTGSVSDARVEIENLKKEVFDSLNIQINTLESKFSFVNENISELLKSAGEKLDGFSNEKISEINAEITDLKDQILIIKNSAGETLVNAENDISKFKDAVVNDIQKNIDRVNEQFESFESRYSELFNSKSAEIDNFSENIKSHFASDFEKMSSDFRKLENELESKFETASEKIISGYNGTLNELKAMVSENVSEFESEYRENTANMIEEFRNKWTSSDGEYLTRLSELEEKYIAKFEHLSSLNSSSAEESRKLYETRLSEIEGKYLSEIGNIRSIFDETVNEMQSHLSNIHDELNSTAVNMDRKYHEKYKVLESEYNAISENISNIKNGIFDDLNSHIEKLVHDSEAAFSEKSDSLTDSFRDIEKEMIEKINNYRSEMHKVQQNLSGIEIKYSDLFNRKMGDYDAKIIGKFNEVRGIIDDNLKILNSRITEVSHDYSLKIEELEEEFTGRAEAMLVKNAKRLDDFELHYSDLNDRISILKNSLSDEIALSIESGKESIREVFESEVSSTKQYFDITAKEVKDGISEFKNEFIRLQNSMKQVDDKFTAKFIEHSNVLSKRIASIEGEVTKFEKNLTLVEKTNSMKDKLNEEIKDIKEKISLIRVDKEELQKIEKNILNIENIAKKSEEKYSKLFNDAMRLDNINDVLVELKEMTESVELKIENIKNAKILIGNVESGINMIKSKSSELEDILNDLNEKQEIVKLSMDSIDSARNEASELRGMISKLNQNYDELDFKRGTYEKNIKQFEKDASLIMKSQSKIDEIMAKFREMDSFVVDIEERTSSIMKLREWLVKAETQMENLNYETDKRIKKLEAINKNNNEEKNDSKTQLKQEDSKRKMVLQLKSQGWSIDEIAKTSNLSIGEVEFILDLEVSNNKK